MFKEAEISKICEIEKTQSIEITCKIFSGLCSSNTEKWRTLAQGFEWFIHLASWHIVKW